MELKRISKNNEDGTAETTWLITDEQMHALINFAINELMKKGLIKIIEEESDDGPSILESLEKEEFYSA